VAARAARAAKEVRITDPVTGGQKGQKPERFDLIPFEALTEVARVYGFGATKYADDNWRKGYAWRLSLGAMLRHIAAWAMGYPTDPESKLPHLAHAAWHCLTLLTFEAHGLGTDDRAKHPGVPIKDIYGNVIGYTRPRTATATPAPPGPKE
jgi:hypothetical protein